MRRQTKEGFYKRYVELDNGCWNFTGAIGRGGYGLASYHGKIHHAHRLSWILTNGEIPNGLLACHKCDNRLCINPAHLFLGTNLDNTIDMMNKGRHRTSPRGIDKKFRRRADVQSVR